MGIGPSPPPSRSSIEEIIEVAGQQAASVLDLTPKLKLDWSAAERLLDLRLPSEIIDLLATPLETLGMAIEEEELADRYTSLRRKITLIRQFDVVLYLLYVPPEILSNPTPDNLSAFNLIPFAFERDATMCVFSEGLDSPHLPFALSMSEGWREMHGVEVWFLPWVHMSGLEQAPDDTEQVRIIASLLRLQTADDRGSAQLPPDSMPINESIRLRGILVDLPEFDTAAGRRSILEQAGMAALVPGLALDGVPREVAGTMIYKLIEHGRLESQPEYHALGALITYLHKLTDLAAEDRSFIESLMNRYLLAYA